MVIQRIKKILRIVPFMIASAHCSGLTEAPKVEIVCTTALIDYNYDMRKEEYIYSISLLKQFGYEPYIFEACKASSPSYFEILSENVFYSNVNDYRLINKGVNEGRSMIEGFKHYQFDDEAMIVKTTGRYWFNSRNFLNTVESHPEVDAFIKFDTGYPIQRGKAFTGCYAIRYKYFKDFLKQLDFAKMERELIDIEIEVAHYVRKMEQEGLNVMTIDKVDMTANIGGPYPPVYTQW